MNESGLNVTLQKLLGLNPEEKAALYQFIVAVLKDNSNDVRQSASIIIQEIDDCLEAKRASISSASEKFPAKAGGVFRRAE